MTSLRWLKLTLATGMLGLVAGRICPDWVTWLLFAVTGVTWAGTCWQVLRGK